MRVGGWLFHERKRLELVARVEERTRGKVQYQHVHDSRKLRFSPSLTNYHVICVLPARWRSARMSSIMHDCVYCDV